MKTAHAIQQTAVMTCSARVPSSWDVSLDHVNALGSGSASMAMSTTGTPTMKPTSARVARRPRSLESVLFIARYLRGCGRVARSRCR